MGREFSIAPLRGFSSVPSGAPVTERFETQTAAVEKCENHPVYSAAFSSTYCRRPENVRHRNDLSDFWNRAGRSAAVPDAFFYNILLRKCLNNIVKYVFACVANEFYFSSRTKTAVPDYCTYVHVLTHPGGISTRVKYLLLC